MSFSSVVNAARSKLGNYTDLVGSYYGLPEVGLSEDIAGGNTINSNKHVNSFYQKGPTYGVQGPVAPATKPAPTLNPSNNYFADTSNSGSNFDAGAAVAAAAAGTTGDSSSTTVNPASIAELDGTLYDLSNPTQAQNYFSAANKENLGVADHNLAITDANLDTSSSNLDYNTKEALDDLNTQKQQLQTDKNNYFSTLEKNGQDLVSGKQLGDVSRGNYFSGLGANAFQSSQATSQDYADGQLDQGLAEQQSAANDATTKYATQGTALDTKQADINRQASQDAATLAQQRADAQFQHDNYYSTAQGQVAAALGQASADAGLTDYASKYAVTPYSNVETNTPDLSGVQQFTNFQPINATPTATPGSTFNGISPGASSLTPLDNYFGYTPTAKDKARISNYFAGNLSS